MKNSDQVLQDAEDLSHPAAIFLPHPLQRIAHWYFQHFTSLSPSTGKINWKFIPNSHFKFNVRKSLLLIISFLQTQGLHEDPLHANYIPILQWHYSFSDEFRWTVYEKYSWIKIQKRGKLYHIFFFKQP